MVIDPEGLIYMGCKLVFRLTQVCVRLHLSPECPRHCHVVERGYRLLGIYLWVRAHQIRGIRNVVIMDSGVHWHLFRSGFYSRGGRSVDQGDESRVVSKLERVRQGKLRSNDGHQNRLFFPSFQTHLETTRSFRHVLLNILYQVQPVLLLPFLITKIWYSEKVKRREVAE
jgi:hypothetical protein